MESLDRVRKAFGMYTNIHTETGVERVDDLFDSVENEVKERYIELPLDANGVPIHVGDEMVGDETDRFVVSELDFTDKRVHVCGFVDGVRYIYVPSKIVHYHKPAVEELLEEYRVKYYDLVTDMECKNITNEEYVQGIRELAAEYAAKLQLKESE